MPSKPTKSVKPASKVIAKAVAKAVVSSTKTAGKNAISASGKKVALAAAPSLKGKAAAAGQTGKVTLATAAPATAEDGEEIDEDELQASAAGGAGGGNAAALAAATAPGATEMSASFKNFRHHPDMENFYRFIYENDLRHEALAMIEQVMVEKQARRAAKASKQLAH